MKNLILVLFILISNLSFSQVKAVIVNSITKEKVPYVNIWVQNEDIGTTSNEQGVFVLSFDGSKPILFSAIGYETKTINSDDIKTTVELHPSVTTLGELVVTPKEYTREVKLGTFGKSDIKSGYACRYNPWILARYFEYTDDYDETLFLKKIKLQTRSNVKDAMYIVHFYSVAESGEPGSDIYAENIIGKAKKGRNFTEIDVSDYHITFPKEGLFVAVEWLVIEQNKHEYNVRLEGSNQNHRDFSYEPTFGSIPMATEQISWLFIRGKWMMMPLYIDAAADPLVRSRMLAVELTLTN